MFFYVTSPNARPMLFFKTKRTRAANVIFNLTRMIEYLSQPSRCQSGCYDFNHVVAADFCLTKANDAFNRKNYEAARLEAGEGLDIIFLNNPMLGTMRRGDLTILKEFKSGRSKTDIEVSDYMKRQSLTEVF